MTYSCKNTAWKSLLSIKKYSRIATTYLSDSFFLEQSSQQNLASLFVCVCAIKQKGEYFSPWSSTYRQEIKSAEQ